ncbi:hypothetical protein [Lacrimispora sp.]|uniref:hypothetical protein n=1 Tax=Lacrimispora sp. TaxID=2719234 RepID=UPI0028AC02FD|nr:hypothetical protein [Lacrimispora sp.]
MNFIKIITKAIAFIVLVIIIVSNFNSVVKTSKNRVYNYEEIELLRSESATLDKIKKLENQQIYDSIDDFPYDSMGFADDNTFRIIKNVYGNINFYGEFNKGNIELYDYYKEKFIQLLNCTVKFKHIERGEEYYLNEYGCFKPYNNETFNLREYNYCFFDVNNDGAPELCIQEGSSSYIFKYIPQTDDFVLWYELFPSNYQLNGTRKVRWEGLGSGLSGVFYELDAEGHEECTVYFFSKRIYNSKTDESYEVAMVSLPKYAAFNQEDIMLELANQAYFSKGNGTYYFRVTEEQFNALTKDYYEAAKLSRENIKEVTFTYDELFGDF